MKKRNTMRRLLRYLKKYWLLLALSLLFAALTVAMTLYLPILIGQQQFVHVNTMDHAGLLHRLAPGRRAAQAVHPDVHKQRGGLGGNVQNITNDGVLSNGHVRIPPVSH